jgi:hypothetical protein
MASGESHAVRNGVITTVVGGVVLAILGEIWSPVKSAIGWVWEKVLAFAGLFGETYAVPGWVLAILGFLALVTVVRAIIGWRSNSAAPIAAVSHRTYVEDILFGAKWRWSWSGGDVSNLWCFCPVCDAELVYDDSSAHRFHMREEPQTLFICEHCNRNVMGRIAGGDKEYALGAVRREIRRRVRTGQYSGSQNVG